MKKAFVFGAAIAAAVAAQGAALKLGRPFTDGMVLQRDMPVRTWGTAATGAEVRVSFAGKTVSAKADAAGVWRADLPPMAASREGRVLAVAAGAETCVCSNVVVGEVWFCSGQSNMEMALADWTPRYGDAIGHMVAQVARKPLVRYLDLKDSRARWEAFTPAFLRAGRKAALAVHYALELYAKLEIPVGVAVASVGGSSIDKWNPAEGAKASYHVGFVKPFAPYSMRGAIWYQGETNLREGALYTKKLHQLYDGWAAAFENPRFSFYYVQIAPYAYGGKDGDACFPVFLEAQAQFAREEPRAAMTVINDVGDVKDIHPGNKWLVAQRLALHALKRDCGWTDVEDESPVVRTASATSNVVEVVFDHAQKLYMHDAARTLDAPFELAGTNGVWKTAKVLNWTPGIWCAWGMIHENRILLAAPGLDAPVRVRYCWNKPWTGVLFNHVDLPLGTFSALVERRGK